VLDVKAEALLVEGDGINEEGKGQGIHRLVGLRCTSTVGVVAAYTVSGVVRLVDTQGQEGGREEDDVTSSFVYALQVVRE
jgi:hypothetical protein